MSLLNTIACACGEKGGIMFVDLAIVPRVTRSGPEIHTQRGGGHGGSAGPFQQFKGDESL